MKTEHLVHPFDPVFNSESRVLILGSFPSVISRQQSFYYANRHNRFWSLMSLLFEEKITDRKEFCLKHNIALWDVIASCTIRGSSDSSITDVMVNDIASLIADTRIQAVFTTGRKASTLYERYIKTDTAHYPLPSTSGANASMRMDDLLEHYRIIREILDEKD